MGILEHHCHIVSVFLCSGVLHISCPSLPFPSFYMNLSELSSLLMYVPNYYRGKLPEVTDKII